MKKLSVWCKERGLTYQTGWNLFKAGKIPNSHKLESGTILIDDDDNIKEDFNVVYARVSSSEQRKTNLETQAIRVSNFIEAQGRCVHKVVKEVGSGVNDSRKMLLSILMDDRVTHIYVEHKDRLTRFGFNYIKLLCDFKNIKIVVINESETDEEDLIKDFASLLTSFCSRLYGLRRSKRKTIEIIEKMKLED